MIRVSLRNNFTSINEQGIVIRDGDRATLQSARDPQTKLKTSSIVLRRCVHSIRGEKNLLNNKGHNFRKVARVQHHFQEKQKENDTFL